MTTALIDSDELKRRLRTGRMRPFLLTHQDLTHLKALVAADPTKWQVTTFNGRQAYIREREDGAYDLFLEDFR